MTVTHDLVAAVQGPGWKFGLSRILIDDQGNGVVFIAGSEEPFVEFTGAQSSTSRGTATVEGGEVQWRRRGSSCQYKLAKCKVKTETLESWWERAKAAADEPELPLGENLEDLL